MSLPRYAEYKNSGVDALGLVPAHWAVFPLKRELAFLTSGSRGWAEHYADEGDLFIRITNLTRDSARLDLRDLQFVKVPEGAEGERTRVQAGDVLFSITAYLGSVAVVPTTIGTAYVSQHIALARLRNKRLLPEWVAYFTQSSAGQRLLDTAGYGGTKVQLSLEDIANLPIPVPQIEDQRSAVAFLDRETGKIDTLIAEQEKLLTLLAEKRQATISHAVTRGLNSNAPMKKSGVQWLGEVPAHWDVKSLKHVIDESKAGPFGSAITKDMYVSEGYRVYGQEQVIPADFSKGDYFINEEKYLELQHYSVASGDILISCVGTFGKIAIVPEGVHPGVINPRLIRLRVADDVSAGFLVTVLRSAVVFEQFSLLSRGGTMDVINIGTLSGIDLAIPPIEEQFAIVHFTAREAAKVEALRDEAGRAIVLLKERRSALIASAVTGKIDVRKAA